ncbi:MAG: hypothetical protein IPG45_07690 [Deltaproteobacteria bacterium]|nr:hypothetical protein [Deltaproteobacteria bacterium]
MIRPVVCLFLCSLPALARAEPTRELSIRGPKEVLAGDPESSSVDALGQIGPGPVSVVIAPGAQHPILTLLPGPNGTLDVGTAQGGLGTWSPTGGLKGVAPASTRLYAALARSKGVLYAGLSPDAELVKIEGGVQKPFAKLTQKYVWALLPIEGAGAGELYAATGEPGQVLKVAGNGKTEVLYDPGETHVRALLLHPRRGLIAGSGQKGVVYQLAKTGAFALYDSELEEVTSLAHDPETGDLYAAFVSEAKAGEVHTDRYIGPAKGDDEGGSPFKGSEVVRIKPDGQTELLWSSKTEGALALVMVGDRLYFATGTGPKGRGRIYSVERSARDRLVLHARLEAPLVTALVPAPTGGGALIAGTAPGGELVRIGPGARSEAVYLSSEQDLGRLSTVGQLWFDAQLPKGARVELSARIGNTKVQDSTWSSFSAAIDDPQGGAVSLPKGRYLQLKVVLRSAPNGEAPLLRSMHASVVRANVPPRVQEVFLLRRGVYMASMPPEEEREKTVTLSRNLLKELRGPEEEDEQRLRVRQGLRPGMLTVAIVAEDPNRDGLLYRVELRREGEEWIEVEDETADPYYSFDSRTRPDGRYQVRVTASDRPANPPELTLVDRAESDPFLIDNTPPRLSAATARAQGEQLLISVEASDELSRLGAAEVSIDGGPWVMLPAKDGLLDARQETLAATVWNPSKKPRPTVLIRVEDEAGNVATTQAR